MASHPPPDGSRPPVSDHPRSKPTSRNIPPVISRSAPTFPPPAGATATPTKAADSPSDSPRHRPAHVQDPCAQIQCFHRFVCGVQCGCIACASASFQDVPQLSFQKTRPRMPLAKEPAPRAMSLGLPAVANLTRCTSTQQTSQNDHLVTGGSRPPSPACLKVIGSRAQLP